MTKVTISPRKNLPNGTLMWIYANNKKVYYSSKGYDTDDFSEHDSNYLGEIEKVCKNQQLRVVASLLNKTERIYGICINEKNNSSTKDIDVLFFPSWDKLLSYAAAYSNESDQLELQRKEEAKRKWLEQGRRYLKNKEQKKKI